MKTRFLIIVLVAVLLALPLALNAGQYSGARSMSLAKSFTSLARDYDAIGINPANLALDGGHNLSVQIFSAGVDLSNNSFSYSDYTKYNGEHLSQSDKDDILSKIPSSGLQGNFESGASAFLVTRGKLAFGLTGSADGDLTMDKEVFELIFNGNTMGDSIDVSDADGEAVGHADINLAYASHLANTRWGKLNWGVNLKYIQGITYAKVEEAEGYLVTRASGIDSDGSVAIKTSQGGSGFGADVGLSMHHGQDWTFSLAVTNLISTISWSNENKLNTYVFNSTDATLENSDEDGDTTYTSEDYEEDIGSFSSSLAPQLALGASTNYKSFLLSFDLKQGFKNLGNVSTTPELSLGCEAHYFSFLPLRLGFSLGGSDGTQGAVGFGLNLGGFKFDFAYLASGSLLPFGGKGLGLALSTGLTF